jgi:M6 family metalloprotease-like protein
LDLQKECLDAYDTQINYADYDLDQDGDIDGLYIFWTGPDTGWNTFWWAYQNSLISGSPKWDGVVIKDYVWAWYTNPWNTTGSFDSTVVMATGHMLGLSDYYDYNSTPGPDGGVGGYDMMDIIS